MTAAALKAVRFKDTSERMMSLADLCILVRGRVPIVVEVKSHFDGDRRLVKRMAEVLASYPGPAAGMSFDPDQVVALREMLPKLPRGIVAQRHYSEADWPEATPAQREACCHLKHAFRTQPHFVAYWVNESAGTGALDRAPYFRPAAPDLDRTHGRAGERVRPATPIR